MLAYTPLILAVTIAFGKVGFKIDRHILIL